MFGPKVVLLWKWDQKKWDDTAEVFQEEAEGQINQLSSSENGEPGLMGPRGSESVSFGQRSSTGQESQDIIISNSPDGLVHNSVSASAFQNDPFNPNVQPDLTGDSNYRSRLEMEKLDLF